MKRLKYNGIYVTGTDTGVGKTVVCGLLKRYLREQGYVPVVQKWVQTGADDDVTTHRTIGGVTEGELDYDADIIPYRFILPASPHLAARQQQTRIDARRLSAAFRRLTSVFSPVIVESAGGLLVPINNRSTLLDVAQGLSLPVLLVSANRIGAINHTLLAVEALRRRNMSVIGVVFNDRSSIEDDRIRSDNPVTVHRHSGVKVLGRLTYQERLEDLQSSFGDIGREIMREIT
jgi:dethiobiotin synthetase